MSFEKVNPSHPDKVADRIAGAIVDLAYKKQDNPKIAVEVLIGHGICMIIAETSVRLGTIAAEEVVDRIIGDDSIITDYLEVPQDAELAKNQAEAIRCGDNGIFKGVPMNDEENKLSASVGRIWAQYPTDGKFIYDEESSTFIACQSNIDKDGYALIEALGHDALGAKRIIINPLGDWTGGTNVDTGATNRKLGSDMGRAVTGGGLHGKDLSKADVAINIWCYLEAKENRVPVEAFCNIGSDTFTARMDGEDHLIPYEEAVAAARNYINKLGGFEKLAEWGLI